MGFWGFGVLGKAIGKSIVNFLEKLKHDRQKIQHTDLHKYIQSQQALSAPAQLQII